MIRLNIVGSMKESKVCFIQLFCPKPSRCWALCIDADWIEPWTRSRGDWEETALTGFGGGRLRRRWDLNREPLTRQRHRGAHLSGHGLQRRGPCGAHGPEHTGQSTRAGAHGSRHTPHFCGLTEGRRARPAGDAADAEPGHRHPAACRGHLEQGTHWEGRRRRRWR